MAVTHRRTFRALLLAVALAFVGSVLSASPATAGGSAPAPGASGTVGVLGQHFVRYCVKHFAPHSDVTVTNTTIDKSVTLHTDANGAGCTLVPIKRECKANTEHIVATGTGADGKPATVRSTVVVPATPSLCEGTSSSSGGTLPFTGADILLMVVIALVLVGAGAGLMVVRRRREDAAS